MTETTWNKLFNFLAKYIKFGDGKYTPYSATCDDTHKFTIAFCKKYKLDEDIVIRMVRSYGGYCDCEILFNMSDRIKHKFIPRLTQTMYEQLGTSDEELRPDDTFCFLADNGIPGWTDGFKTMEDAIIEMNNLKNKGIKIVFEPTVDINARNIRDAKNDN